MGALDVTDWGSLADWAIVGGGLLSAGGGILTVVMSARFAAKSVVEHHSARIEAQELRIRALEKAQDDQPDVHDLAQRIERVSGDFKAISAQIAGLSDAITRIERPLNMLLEHELRGGK